jgi:hypothetical protein
LACRAFLKIDKVLDDIGEYRLKIEVVKYEEGIHALLSGNKISMQAWGLSEEAFPLEIVFASWCAINNTSPNPGV